jgi:type VI secretion system secreted protein Hcp
MAEVDYFLFIDGIKGESQDAQYKEHIQLESWSWGESQRGTHTSSHGGGGGAGKVAMEDFHFTMKTNKATVPLMSACATGQHLKKAVLYCRKAGKQQQTYFCITLTDVIVSSYQTAGASEHVIPVDQVKLNYAEIEWVYHEQKADGSLAASNKKGYNLKAQQSK